MYLFYHNLEREKNSPCKAERVEKRPNVVRNIIPSLSPYLIACPFSLIQSVREGKIGGSQGLVQGKQLQIHKCQSTNQSEGRLQS